MAIIDALLKISDGDGNLKKFTATEENYLAYQAGIQLAQAGISKVASLSTGAGNTVGTFTDTKFNESVGDHGVLTTATTNTTIYQNTGTAPEDPPFAKPVLWDHDPGNIKALNDTQLNTVVDRLLLTIFAGDYPGTYRLATSAPSADYSAHLSNVFTDTRTDGTSVNYTIWKRQSMTPPTVVKTVRLEGTKDLKRMSTVEMQATFGQRAKTRIMSTGIGTYLLRSSADGAPTAPGTWVAKGTATNTKQQTSDVNYTRDSTRVSTRDSTQNFTRVSQSNYVSNYTAVYDGDYVGTTQYIAAAYVGEYAGTYSGTAFEGNYTDETYTGNYIATYAETAPGTNYQRTSTVNFQRTSTVNYQRIQSFAGFSSFVGDYIGDFTGDFVGNFVGDYTSIQNYSTDYLGEYTGDFVGNYISNYEGNYAGEYVPNYVGPITYTGHYDAAYQNEYTGDYTGDYVGNFIGDYTGNYTGDYTGETIQAGNETVETYTLYVRTA